MAKNFTQFKFGEEVIEPIKGLVEEQKQEVFRQKEEIAIQEKLQASQDFIKNKKGWGLFPDGSSQFQAFQVRNVIKTVPLNGDIQGAIDILFENGGGEVVLSAGTYKLSTSINMKDGVALRGSGIGNTIIDFGFNDAAIISDGATFGTVDPVLGATETNRGVNLSDLSITSASYSLGSVVYESSTQFTIENVYIDLSDSHGFNFAGCYRFSVRGCIADRSTDSGFNFENANFLFSVENCLSQDNDNGFRFNTVEDFSVISCSSLDDVNGFLTVSGAGDQKGTFIGCVATECTGNGFDITTTFNSFIRCVAQSCSGDGFEINSPENTFFGCYAENNSTFDFVIAEGGVFIGNELGDTNLDVTEDDVLQVIGNLNQTINSGREVARFDNNSGGTIEQGDVVVWAPTGSGADARHIDTTTTKGDRRVLGIVDGAGSVSNGGNVSIVLKGMTTRLKVNGEEDIAVGDWLQTHTVAGISALASTAGQTVFARALEAYTTGNDNGIIDAYIFPARTL